MTLLEQVAKLERMCQIASMLPSREVEPVLAKLREVMEALHIGLKSVGAVDAAYAEYALRAMHSALAPLPES